MRWNFSSKKLSTENHALWDSLSYNRQNWECWNFTIISSKNSVTLTSMKNLKWIPSPFTKPCPKKIWRTLFFPKNELNGTNYLLMIALITSRRMQPTIFPPELAVMPTRNLTRESRDYLKKSLDVQKCCARLAKPIIASIERVASTNSVARNSIKEL